MKPALDDSTSMGSHVEVATSTFGASLRELRHALGWSQEELAHRGRVSTRHLSCLETGRARPGREVTRRLLAALSVSPSDRARLAGLAGFALEETVGGSGSAVLFERLHSSPYPGVVLAPDDEVFECNHAFDRLLSRIAPPNELWTRTCAGGPRNLRTLTVHPDGLAPLLVNLDAVVAAFDARRVGAESTDVVEVYRLDGEELCLRPLVTRFADHPHGLRLEHYLPTRSTA